MSSGANNAEYGLVGKTEPGTRPDATHCCRCCSGTCAVLLVAVLIMTIIEFIHKPDCKRGGCTSYYDDGWNPRQMPIRNVEGFAAERFWSWDAKDNSLSINDTHAFVPFFKTMRESKYVFFMKGWGEFEMGHQHFLFVPNMMDSGLLSENTTIGAAVRVYPLVTNKSANQTGYGQSTDWHSWSKGRWAITNWLAKQLRGLRRFVSHGIVLFGMVPAQAILLTGLPSANVELSAFSHDQGSAPNAYMKGRAVTLREKLREMSAEERASGDPLTARQECFHMDNVRWNKTGMFVPLNTKIPSYAGIGFNGLSSALDLVAGTSVWTYDAQLGKLEAYFGIAFQGHFTDTSSDHDASPMGLYLGKVDGASWQSKVASQQYNPFAPSLLVYGLSSLVSVIPRDLGALYEDRETRCPRNKLNRIDLTMRTRKPETLAYHIMHTNEKFHAPMQLNIVSEWFALAKLLDLELVRVMTDFIYDCGAEFFRPYPPLDVSIGPWIGFEFSHALLEAGHDGFMAMLHACKDGYWDWKR